MQCLIRILAIILLISAAFADDLTPADLPALVAQAQQALAPATYDVGTCRTRANRLEQFLTANPKTPELPDLLLLCAKCDAACGNLQRAGVNASRVVDQFPLSAAAPMAYEIARKSVSNDGVNPSAAASLARNYAEGLSGDPRAVHYWRECLDWHRQAGEWNDVLSVGLHCLNAQESLSADPAVQLIVAEAALKTNDTARATALFEQLAARKDNAPQSVLAHRRLAMGGDARKHNEAAWALYHKNSSKPEFARQDVAKAAAQALWDLQELAFQDYVKLVQAPKFDESKCRRALSKLEDGYNDVLNTNSECAAPSLNRIGDAHALFADALLSDGERRAKEMPEKPPYGRALPEYARAVSAYARAFEQASGHDEQAEAARAAAQHAFDLTVRQGDVVAEWGRALYDRAPTESPGVDSRKPRLDYLNKTVVPVLTTAVEYYGRAIEFAPYMPLDESTAVLRARFDSPLRPLATSMTELIEEYAHRLNASAAELGSMSSMSFDAVAVERQEVKVEAEFEQLLDAQNLVRFVMTNWSALLSKAALPAESQTFWGERNVHQFDKTSGALRAVQVCVAKSLNRLERTNDLTDLAFRRKLTKLQARAVSEEYHSLVSWHEYVSQGDVHHPANDRLYARLADVDPAHFSTAPNSGAATRRHP